MSASIKLFRDNKDNFVEDTDNILLVPEVPFYGIGGTICRIEEANESYYKVLYNSDGSIRTLKIPVSKKKNKNLSFLLNDYINEVRNYLDKSHNKYVEYSKNKVKTNLSNKEFFCLLVVTILAILASIPFLFTTSVIGLFFCTFSFLALYILLDIHKKDKEKEKNYVCFVRKYEILQKLMNDYDNGEKIVNLEKSNTKLRERCIDKKNDNVSILNGLMANDNCGEVA